MALVAFSSHCYPSYSALGSRFPFLFEALVLLLFLLHSKTKSLTAPQKGFAQFAVPVLSVLTSNQVWTYQMKACTHRLKENRISQSLSRKGNGYGNSAMENFFGLLKQEIDHGLAYYSYEE